MARAPIRDLPSGIRCYKDTNGRGDVAWRVRLGKRFTGASGIRKNFRTLEEARDWIHGDGQKLRAHVESPLSLKAKAGSSGFELTGPHIADAASAIRALGDSGTLTQAVAYYLQKAKPKNGSHTVHSTIDELIKSKERAERSHRHIKGLRTNVKRFAAKFGKKNIHEISSAQIENWLDGEGFVGTTRRNYIRDLNILFRFAQKRGWATTNPTVEIERPKQEDKEHQILTPDEVAEFLAFAEDVAPILAAALAVKFFAGVRTSELFKLEWTDIRNGKILVKGAHAKTRQRRSVTISPNLQKWLSRYAGSEQLTQRTDNEWHRDLQTIEASVNARRQFAGTSGALFELPPNGARHCFCSYHYELHQNENLTAAEAGNTPDVIFRNYRTLVADHNDAVRYWDIVPVR